MHNKYVRLRDLREELGITAKGLDNAIKRKEIEKKYPHEKNIPYLLESDAEIIKHYIINNGRVKAIIEKDKKDIALENEKNKLDEENNRILNELAITVTKLESAEKTIASLNEDKTEYKHQIHNLNEQNKEYQERLKELNQLLLIEKAEVDKLKKLYADNKTLLLEAENNKNKLLEEKEAEIKSMLGEKNELEHRVSELEDKFNDLNNKSIFQLIKYKLMKK